MTRLHFDRKTTLTPAQYVAGLTDFGLGRSKVFTNSADRYLVVHHVGHDATSGRRVRWLRAC